MNKKLQDQPNHGHYPYCAMRKKQIEKASVKILAVSALSGTLMAILRAVNWLAIMLLVFFAIMNFFRSKAYGIPVFIFYALLSTYALFSGISNPANAILLFFGLVGIAVSWRVFHDFADQRQLEITEGYPFFNEIYTELKENPDYSTRYEDVRDPGTIKKSYPGDSTMQELCHASDSCKFQETKSGPAEMNDLFAPAENPEPEASPEPKPELKPEPKPEPVREPTPKPVCKPTPEIKPETVPEPKVSVKKYDKSIQETSTSLFDDDYELPSIKPLYFQRMEEERKQQQE